MVVPFGVYAVLAVLILFILYYRIERVTHEKRLRSIPERIWVNGTRGKSSVTRLIAAGLRAGGKKVIAKTTGTSPRLIIDDTSEQPVIRLGMANIREQVQILKRATEFKPAALVLECMALRPDLQKTESVQIIRPTAVAITNVRPDHLDVMGPTIKDIAKTFISVIPRNCPVFTSEPDIFNSFLKDMCKKNIKISVSNADRVSNEDIKEFPYIEHKENVALALDVCKHFGVDEETAMKGMQNASPDPGALKKHYIRFDTKQITLINAMAANDPESTHRIWRSLDKNYSEIYLLVNCRDDRIDRSFQFAELIIKHLKAEKYILTGKGTEVLMRKLTKTIDRAKILDLGSKTTDEAVNAIAKLVSDGSLIFAMANAVGYGVEMMEQFLKYRSG